MPCGDRGGALGLRNRVCEVVPSEDLAPWPEVGLRERTKEVGGITCDVPVVRRGHEITQLAKGQGDGLLADTEDLGQLSLAGRSASDDQQAHEGPPAPRPSAGPLPALVGCGRFFRGDRCRPGSEGPGVDHELHGIRGEEVELASLSAFEDPRGGGGPREEWPGGRVVGGSGQGAGVTRCDRPVHGDRNFPVVIPVGTAQNPRPVVAPIEDHVQVAEDLHHVDHDSSLQAMSFDADITCGTSDRHVSLSDARGRCGPSGAAHVLLPRPATTI
jgi:hypothetical protein